MSVLQIPIYVLGRYNIVVDDVKLYFAHAFYIPGIFKCSNIKLDSNEQGPDLIIFCVRLQFSFEMWVMEQ